MDNLISSPRTILVLGGGGMKGMAHIGVWRALEEREIRIDAIIGTSVGSLIGAMIAHGLRADELEAIARTIKKDDVVQVNRRIHRERAVGTSEFIPGRKRPHTLFLLTN